MTITRLISSPIVSAIRNPIRDLPLGGMIIVTTDNKVLVTTDNKIGTTRK